MSFFDELTKFSDFEDFKNRDIWNKIKAQPERVLIGAWDPFSSAMWSKITGNHYDPVINQLGGPTNDQLDRGSASPGTRATHAVAGVVAGAMGGPSALGGIGSGIDAAAGGLGVGGADIAASGTGMGGAASDSSSSLLSSTGPSASSAADSAGTGDYLKYATAAHGLLNQPAQQQNVPPQAMQAPDQQAMQRARIKMAMEQQRQQLLMKPNKTMQDYLQLAQLRNQQGLLGQQ